MSKGLFSLLIGGLLTATVSGYREKAGVLTRSVKTGTATYSYQVYVPAKLQGKQKLPVILFLHGIGQRGEGGFVPTQRATGALVQSYLNRVPAIVLLPQCRANSYWSDAEMDEMVMRALAQTIAEFGADERRLYLTGVSMGGYGVWHLAAEHPEKFAALVSICGGSPLRGGDKFTPIAQSIKHTPVWVFHGADDPVVPVSESREMVAALRAVGGNVIYSEYAGVGRNVWMKALAEPKLLSWLLSNARTSKGNIIKTKS